MHQGCVSISLFTCPVAYTHTQAHTHHIHTHTHTHTRKHTDAHTHTHTNTAFRFIIKAISSANLRQGQMLSSYLSYSSPVDMERHASHA